MIEGIDHPPTKIAVHGCLEGSVMADQLGEDAQNRSCDATDCTKNSVVLGEEVCNTAKKTGFQAENATEETANVTVVLLAMLSVLGLNVVASLHLSPALNLASTLYTATSVDMRTAIGMDMSAAVCMNMRAITCATHLHATTSIRHGHWHRTRHRADSRLARKRNRLAPAAAICVVSDNADSTIVAKACIVDHAERRVILRNVVTSVNGCALQLLSQLLGKSRVAPNLDALDLAVLNIDPAAAFTGINAASLDELDLAASCLIDDVGQLVQACVGIWVRTGIVDLTTLCSLRAVVDRNTSTGECGVATCSGLAIVAALQHVLEIGCIASLASIMLLAAAMRLVMNECHLNPLSDLCVRKQNMNEVAPNLYAG